MPYHKKQEVKYVAEKALTVAFFMVLALLVAEYIIVIYKRNPKRPRCVAFVFPDGDPDGLESLLIYTYSRLKCGFNKDGALYFIMDAASKEEIKIAEVFCKDHYGAKVISIENLRDILGDAVYKTARFVLY